MYIYLVDNRNTGVNNNMRARAGRVIHYGRWWRRRRRYINRALIYYRALVHHYRPGAVIAMMTIIPAVVATVPFPVFMMSRRTIITSSLRMGS
jgi:hypothetical protein